MAQNTDVYDTLIDQEREKEATELVAEQDVCLVEGTSNELYDCCGSDLIRSECHVFGMVNFVICGGLMLVILALHYNSRWFRR